MKTKEQKQKDLNALTEELNNSKSAMVVSFDKVTVNKDQEFRNQLRDAGAKYRVVKNTLARLAVKGTPYEGTTDHFKGVSAIAWTDTDAVVLSKAISKFIKENAANFTFKAGIVEGRVVDLNQVEAIAKLPSKEELIAKLMFVLNAQAQRIVTVINAVPRDLAVVIKQIGEGKTDAPAEQKTETAEQPPAEEVKAEETAPATDETSETPAAATESEPAVETEAPAETQQNTEPEATAEQAVAPEAETKEKAEPEAEEKSE